MSDSQKTAVIFGLANKRSIAWAIAQKLHQAGWRLAITYQNERLGLEADLRKPALKLPAHLLHGRRSRAAASAANERGRGNRPCHRAALP